jgi:thymidine kinase
MSLDIVLGPMWAGKSSYILSRIRRYKAIGWNVMVITHSNDNRYGEQVISNHDHDQLSAKGVNQLLPLLLSSEYDKAQLIVIEEAQFFTDLFVFVTGAVDTDKKHVLCSGLDGDSERRPFGDLLRLIPYSDNVEKIKSLCIECRDGTPALFTYRLDQTQDQIAVGATDRYAPLCRKHYNEKKSKSY